MRSGNPHAGKEGVSRKMIPLGDEEEEWTDLVEECENAADSDVIVSTPAGHVQRLVQADTYFSAAVEELNRRAVLLWVINGQRDCVELLRQYLDNRPSNAVTVHVVRNAGLARRFDLFNNTTYGTDGDERRRQDYYAAENRSAGYGQDVLGAAGNAPGNRGRQEYPRCREGRSAPVQTPVCGRCLTTWA